MSDPSFFGNGSLVNLTTHSYENPKPATLTGWSRVWEQSALRPYAFLSVQANPTAKIDGIIATVPNGDWAALDERESGYHRIDITDQLNTVDPTAIYQGSPAQIASAGSGLPILLSYLDVFVQGFHTHFGEDGVQRFFDTTDRWDTPILNDRANPLYPRHRTLAQKETELVDNHIQRLSAVVKQPV